MNSYQKLKKKNKKLKQDIYTLVMKENTSDWFSVWFSWHSKFEMTDSVLSGSREYAGIGLYEAIKKQRDEGGVVGVPEFTKAEPTPRHVLYATPEPFSPEPSRPKKFHFSILFDGCSFTGAKLGRNHAIFSIEDCDDLETAFNKEVERIKGIRYSDISIVDVQIFN